jgi:hypothetical protein
MSNTASKYNLNMNILGHKKKSADAENMNYVFNKLIDAFPKLHVMIAGNFSAKITSIADAGLPDLRKIDVPDKKKPEKEPPKHPCTAKMFPTVECKGPAQIMIGSVLKTKYGADHVELHDGVVEIYSNYWKPLSISESIVTSYLNKFNSPAVPFQVSMAAHAIKSLTCDHHMVHELLHMKGDDKDIPKNNDIIINKSIKEIISLLK